MKSSCKQICRMSILLLSLLLLCACTAKEERTRDVPYTSCLRLTETIPHAGAGYTEGFNIREGKIYESDGQYFSSVIRSYEIGKSEAEDRYSFDDMTFAEGSVFLNGKFYCLTYYNKEAYIFDENMQLADTVPYPRCGWGMTTDGKYLIADDGTDCIYFMDGEYHDVKTIRVSCGGIPITNLNELEYIDGYIWANIWHTDMIVVIDPETGHVVKGLDFSGLIGEAYLADLKDEEREEAVLNGIAYDGSTGKIYITGKYYPDIFVFAKEGTIS